MDSDLDAMTREQLAAEVRKLRNGIRKQAPDAPRTNEPYEKR
jgi:hypothetical protein